MMKKVKYIVATRASALAYEQTRKAVEFLEQKHPKPTFEIRKISTRGDHRQEHPLSQFGGVGVFVKEIEQALLDGEVDFAVHSLKDVPSKENPSLELCSFPKRDMPNDLFLTRDGSTIHDIKQGFVAGTGSPRRQVQIKRARPDARFKDIRGNIDTRISKLEAGNYDALILAAAGFNRSGRHFNPEAAMPVDISLPAIGQGVLVLQCRRDDISTKQLLQSVNHTETELEVQAERTFMKELGGGCQIPVAAYAKIEGPVLRLEGMIGDISLERSIRMGTEGPPEEAEQLAIELARDMENKCKKENIHFHQ